MKRYISNRGQAMTRPRVLLIIPCYNEASSIATLLEEISSCPQNYATIVIDDNSVDNTAAIADKFSPVVRLVRNLGIGGAMQTGFKYAFEHDFDFCVQIDGDGQHPPHEVAKLLMHYQQHHKSITIGSRYIDNDSFRSTWARRMGSKMIAGTLNFLFRHCQVSDPTSGMRLMDRQAIAFFAKRYPHDYPEPISLAWAFKQGLSVGETPVRMRAREHGQSSIFGMKSVAYMFRVLGYVLLARFIY